MYVRLGRARLRAGVHACVRASERTYVHAGAREYVYVCVRVRVRVRVRVWGSMRICASVGVLAYVRAGVYISKLCRPLTYISALHARVTWGMTAPGGKTAPLPVDNLKLPRTLSEYTEWWYHLTDTCFERSTPRSRRQLKYSILNIYTCFDVIFHHHYTSHNYLYIGDNKERNI